MVESLEAMRILCSEPDSCRRRRCTVLEKAERSHFSAETAASQPPPPPLSISHSPLGASLYDVHKHLWIFLPPFSLYPQILYAVRLQMLVLSWPPPPPPFCASVIHGMPLASRRTVERTNIHTISLKFPSGIYGPPFRPPMPMPLKDKTAARRERQTAHKTHENGRKNNTDSRSSYHLPPPSSVYIRSSDVAALALYVQRWPKKFVL